MAVAIEFNQVPTFLTNLLPAAAVLYRSLKQFLTREAQEGLYEFLGYDATLELLDVDGINAVLKTRQRVKFLQDNIIAFQDFAWGDGKVMADYKVSPGIATDRYQLGGRWVILISLREAKSRGDIETFYIERRIKRGLTQPSEWCQITLQHKTRQLKLALVFPRHRRCQRAVLLERNANRTTVLSAAHFQDLPDGRQLVQWSTAQPRRFETYTIQWQW